MRSVMSASATPTDNTAPINAFSSLCPRNTYGTLLCTRRAFWKIISFKKAKYEGISLSCRTADRG